MKTLSALALAISVIGSAPLSAQVHVWYWPFSTSNAPITFESLAIGSAGAGLFGGYDVTVSDGCFLANSFSAAGFGSAGQATDTNAGQTVCAAGSANQAVTLTFAQHLQYFGLSGVSSALAGAPGTLTLTTLHGSVSVVDGNFTNGTPAFLGISDPVGFHSVTISANGNGAFAVDDIIFVTNPEPGSVALLGAGLLAVGIVARRKRVSR